MGHAEFQPAGPKSGEKWELLQIVLGHVPRDGDLKGLHEAVCSGLSKRLGQAHESVTASGDKLRYWSQGPYQEIWSKEGLYDNPLKGQSERVILVEVGVLQGDEEYVRRRVRTL